MIDQKKIKMQYLSRRGFITQGKCKINFQLNLHTIMFGKCN